MDRRHTHDSASRPRHNRSSSATTGRFAGRTARGEPGACRHCHEAITGAGVEARGARYCSARCAHAHGLKLADEQD